MLWHRLIGDRIFVVYSPIIESESVKQKIGKPFKVNESDNLILDPGGLLSLMTPQIEKDFVFGKVIVKPEHIFSLIHRFSNKVTSMDSENVIVKLDRITSLIVPQSFISPIKNWLHSLYGQGLVAATDIKEALGNSKSYKEDSSFS